MQNESLKKLSEDSRALLIAAIASKAVEALIKSTKDAGDGDSGSFTVIVSTADRDRQNEIVMPDGIDLAFYKLNPIVLWAHDYSSLPVAVCTSIAVIDGKLQASGKFAPAAANPFAQQVRMLYDLGMIKAVSIGFIPKEYDANDRDVVLKSEMLEFSFVPVPANAYALSIHQMKELGIDQTLLKTKGININLVDKKDASGDPCKMGDGTPGKLGKNDAGELVCIPDESKGIAVNRSIAVNKAAEDMDKAIEVFKIDHARAHATHNENHMKAIQVFKEAIHEAMKTIDIGKSAKEGVEVFKDAFDEHMKMNGLENQRHSKEMEGHLVVVHKAIEVFKECVKEAMKDYPSTPDTGDDAGMNPTADSVRMHKTIKEAYEHMSAAVAALKDYAESEGGKSAAVDDKAATATKVEPSQAHKDSGVDVESFLKNRELVKTISIAFGKVLRDYNLADRNKGAK